jgi:hypothetical protein
MNTTATIMRNRISRTKDTTATRRHRLADRRNLLAATSRCPLLQRLRGPLQAAGKTTAAPSAPKPTLTVLISITLPEAAANKSVTTSMGARKLS